nr:unnamed protein product [Callosobruchus analis]
MVHTRKGPHKEDEDLIITFFKSEYFASIIENAIETRTNQLVKKIDTLEEIIQNLIAENLKITTMLEKIHCKDGLDVSYGTDVSDATVVEQETRQNNDSHEKHQDKTPRKVDVSKNCTKIFQPDSKKSDAQRQRQIIALSFKGSKKYHVSPGPITKEEEWVFGLTIHYLYGMKNYIYQPTRQSHILDHLFTNLQTSIVAKVIENSISDHNTILCSTNLGSTPKVSHTEFKRSFKAHHVNCFKQDLNNHSWSYLYAHRNLDNAFNDFYGVCLNYFNTHFPLKRHTVKSNTKGWVNDSVKISSSNLKDLFHLKTIFPDIGPSYDEAKKAHVKLIKETKREYYQSKIERSDNKNKTVWQIINSLSNTKKTQPSSLALEINNHPVDDPLHIADSFIEFFEDISSNIIKITQPKTLTYKWFCIPKKLIQVEILECCRLMRYNHMCLNNAYRQWQIVTAVGKFKWIIGIDLQKTLRKNIMDTLQK